MPKVLVPPLVGDFRPIACCSTIYKCIFKLLYDRLSKVLPNIISQTQGALFCLREIHFAQCFDLSRFDQMYNHGKSPPCCLMDLDLSKYYDTVEWAFIEKIITKLGFPSKFTQLIMTCLSTTRYSILLNGSPTDGLETGRPSLPSLVYSMYGVLL